MCKFLKSLKASVCFFYQLSDTVLLDLTNSGGAKTSYWAPYIGFAMAMSPSFGTCMSWGRMDALVAGLPAEKKKRVHLGFNQDQHWRYCKKSDSYE